MVPVAGAAAVCARDEDSSALGFSGFPQSPTGPTPPPRGAAAAPSLRPGPGLAPQPAEQRRPFLDWLHLLHLDPGAQAAEDPQWRLAEVVLGKSSDRAAALAAALCSKGATLGEPPGELLARGRKRVLKKTGRGLEDSALQRAPHWGAERLKAGCWAGSPQEPWPQPEGPAPGQSPSPKPALRNQGPPLGGGCGPRSWP